MNIVIAGAGAMGSRFALMLKQDGHQVTLVDGWPEHIAAIKKDGLRANLDGKEVTASFPIYHQSDLSKVEIETKADLIFVFTKAMQLEKMMQALRPLIHPRTQFLCLLNGIGHEDIIEQFIAPENIFIGNTIWTADLTGPGQARLFGTGAVELQNNAPGKKEEAKQLAAMLSAAGLNASYSENIRYSIYRKACVNGTLNGLCTLLDVNISQFGKTTTARQLVTTIVEEFGAVARAEGILLDQSEVIAHIEETYDPTGIGLHYPSMYQDLINNRRRTEIDYINGAISRKGRKYGIKTPYCDFLTQLIHCKEEVLNAK